MTKVKMTIHRALSELKLIDAKIEKQIIEISPVGIYQKGKPIKGYMKQEEFKTSAESKYQAINDLIERKTNIKSAVVAANGVTNVKVGDKTMTIADAITFKSTIEFKKKLILKMKSSHQTAVSELNKNNQVVEQNVQKLLEFTFGKENVKANASDLEAVRKPYMESNEFHLFDPLEALKTIENMEKEVSSFECDIDSVLSEINAITFIEA